MSELQPPVYDVHSHLLPGIDDGAADLAVSVAMARDAVADGITHMVCTPHTAADTPNLTAHLTARLALLDTVQAELTRQNLPLRLALGAEWMLSPELLDLAPNTGTLAGTNALLFELNAFLPLELAAEVSQALRDQGLQPVLAHPERYSQVSLSCVSALDAVVSAGGVLQLTAGSLTGLFGAPVQKIAQVLVHRYGDTLWLSSDAHEASRRRAQVSAAYAMMNHCQPEAGDRAKERMNTFFSPCFR